MLQLQILINYMFIFLVDKNENFKRLSEEITHFHKSLKRSLNDYAQDAFVMESGQQFLNNGIIIALFILYKKIYKLEKCTMSIFSITLHSNGRFNVNRTH